VELSFHECEGGKRRILSIHMWKVGADTKRGGYESPPIQSPPTSGVEKDLQQDQICNKNFGERKKVTGSDSIAKVGQEPHEPSSWRTLEEKVKCAKGGGQVQEGTRKLLKRNRSQVSHI